MDIVFGIEKKQKLFTFVCIMSDFKFLDPEKLFGHGAREMVPRLGASYAFLGDPSSNPSTHMVAYNFRSCISDTLS